MTPLSRLLPFLMLAAAAFALTPARAQDAGAPFRKVEITLSAPVFEHVAAMRMGAAASLVVHVRGEDRRHAFEVFDAAQLATPGPTPALRIDVPRNALFFSIGEQTDDADDDLLILTETGVHRYDRARGAFQPLVETRSIFRQGVDFRFVRSGFARDLNGDERYDLIVPDFDGTRVFIQSADGTFSDPVLLPVEPEMRMTGRFSNDNISDTELAPPAPTTPAFFVFPLYLFDATGDGRQDIVYNIGIEMRTFAQTATGSFETTAQTARFPFDVRGNRWIDQLAADERNVDQSRFRDITVYRILDLDDDDIAEVITVENKANGVFDREQDFAIYKGRVVNGQLGYGAAPDFTYALEGVGGVGFRDLDNDGRLDLAVTSLKLNIGKVISMLVTRRLKTQTRIFLNHADDSFRDQSDFERATLVGIDLSRGITNNPTLAYADFSGDGLIDLLGADGEDTLILLKTTDAALFDEKIAELKTTLPADGALVHALDINDDERADIAVRYSRLGLDGEDARARLVLFLSQ